MSADALRYLALAKVAFQLRTLELIMGLPASADRSPEGGDAASGSIEDESAVAKPDAQSQSGDLS